MSSGDRVRIQTERKIIVLCEDCFQKLRIPKEKKKLRIRCPNCKHEFDYTYNAFGFSPSTKKHLLIGLVGGFVGFLLVELVQATVLSNMREPLLSAMLAIGAFGVCLGAVMGAGEGFFKKNRPRMYYGLKLGALLGLISGVLSGLIAQVVYASILSPVSADTSPSIALLIFARTIGWSVLGLLIGGSYGIKENTSGDLKFGLIGGAIGGAVGGLLFDPLTSAIQFGGGTIGRLVGFSVLGMAVSIAINRFKEIAISNNRPEMYRQLSRNLPKNPRLQLPSASNEQPPR